uniref:Uncharacterized protein n=1 Tax=Arundo donax TaxID=35708 RepID=A0A0A9H5U2_ARUDO
MGRCVLCEKKEAKEQREKHDNIALFMFYCPLTVLYYCIFCLVSVYLLGFSEPRLTIRSWRSHL